MKSLHACSSEIQAAHACRTQQSPWIYNNAASTQAWSGFYKRKSTTGRIPAGKSKQLSDTKQNYDDCSIMSHDHKRPRINRRWNKQRWDIINKRHEQSKAKQSKEAQAISNHMCPQRLAATKSKNNPRAQHCLGTLKANNQQHNTNIQRLQHSVTWL